MLSTVYISSAKSLFSDVALMDLMARSRANNARIGITGMLVYKDGNFLQVMEGPDEAVKSLYAKILADPRHKGIIKLLQENITERQFPDWSMGFRNLANVDLQETPGYSEFLNEPLESLRFRADPTRAQKLLRMFRQTM